MEEYTIHEVIISDSKGNLFNYHSDYMNENFSYDKEVDQITEYVPTQVQVMLEDKITKCYRGCTTTVVVPTQSATNI